MSRRVSNRKWIFDSPRLVADLRAACKAQGITEDELYRAASLTLAGRRKFETGNHHPRLAVLCVICGMLDLDPRDYFVGSWVEHESQSQTRRYDE